MQVTLLTQVVPNPPDAGPRIKTHYVLRTLAEEHDVDLITFVRDDGEISAAAGLLDYCRSVTTVPLFRKRHLEPWHLMRGWARKEPFLVSRDYRRDFMSAVQQRVSAGRVDVLHADQVSMAQYLRAAQGNVQTVFDAHNAVWQLVQSMASSQPTVLHRTAARIEWRLMRAFEKSAVRTAHSTLAVNVVDGLALVDGATQASQVNVIPIGVEVQDVEPVDVMASSRRILSVGTMHYPPNAEAIRWFAGEILPLIRTSHADVEVDIVGPRPPRDLVAWGQADDLVTVHGYVDSLDELYRQAAVFIVPLRSGSGVRVKVLEAMARGVCVVSTPLGVDGLDVADGEHLLVADSANDFAAAVRQLLDDPERRQAMAHAARERVLSLYDWRVCCRPVLDVYRQLADRTQIPAAAHHVVMELQSP